MSAIKLRAATSDPEAPTRCYSCGRPTQRSTGKGVSATYCKRCIERRRRTGSYWASSIPARTLAPYLTAARHWVKLHREEHGVGLVLDTLGAALSGAGSVVGAYDLRPLPPAAKARVVLARLRTEGVSPERLLEISLAVAARVEHRGPHDADYLGTQIGKVIHRVSRPGQLRTRSGLPVPPKYPRPQGRFLRLLGARLAEVASVACPDLAGIIAEAEPHMLRAEQATAKRDDRQRENLAALRREIEAVRASGWGPAKLARAEAALRRQYDIT